MKKRYTIWTVTVLVLLVITLFYLSSKKDDGGWTTYAGTKEGIRYSANAQINKSNVKNLNVAWVYDTRDSMEKSQIRCNPIIINGILYGTTPKMGLFAIDAVTGKEIWKYKPIHPNARGVIRGIAYWQNLFGTDKRVIYSVGPYMYSVNAVDGKLVSEFGKGGFIDLRDQLDGDYANS